MRDDQDGVLEGKSKDFTPLSIAQRASLVCHTQITRVFPLSLPESPDRLSSDDQ